MNATTPTPWHIGPHYTTDVESSEGRVCECRPLSSPRGVANAELIVRAVNLHDELLAALAALAEHYERVIGDGVTADNEPPQLKVARAALAKAEGRANDD